jgi:pantothenate kinase-related protein Tda10
MPFPLMHSPNGHVNEDANENGPAPCMAARIAEAACLRSLWLRVNRLERLMETARRAQRPQWRTHAEQALRASNEYMRRATG